MNRERLEKLKDVIENWPKESVLNMNTWIERNTCGTAMCAGGMACTVPEFREAGLGFMSELHDFHEATDIDNPVYEGRHGYWALETFFGLSDNQTFHIFSPRRYIAHEYSDITADEVVAHIDMVLGGAVE